MNETKQKQNVVNLLCSMVDAEDVAYILSEFIMENYHSRKEENDWYCNDLDEDDIKDIALDVITYNTDVDYED